MRMSIGGRLRRRMRGSRDDARRSFALVQVQMIVVGASVVGRNTRAGRAQVDVVHSVHERRYVRSVSVATVFVFARCRHGYRSGWEMVSVDVLRRWQALLFGFQRVFLSLQLADLFLELHDAAVEIIVLLLRSVDLLREIELVLGELFDLPGHHIDFGLQLNDRSRIRGSVVLVCWLLCILRLRPCVLSCFERILREFQLFDKD